jgi:hypothetical protein
MDTTLANKAYVDSQTKLEGRPIVSGIVTGQIAGLIMAIVMMIVFTVFLGKSPLYPVQVIGSAVFGEKALEGFHAGALVAGLLLHQLGPSLLWGLVYGGLASLWKVRTASSALLLGLGLSVFSMIVPYLFIPILMNALHGQDFWNREVPMFWDWAAHLVFGASFVLFPKVQAKLR